MNLQELTEKVKRERPRYIFIGDVHFSPDRKELSSALIHEQKKEGLDAGLYVEALYSTADVQEGDYSGSVIKWDNRIRGMTYRELIDSVREMVPVHGIDHPDYPGKIKDGESKERVEHWRKSIQRGEQDVKVILVGAGHIWNDEGNPADIVSLMNGPFWLIKRQRAYAPPKPRETFSLQHDSIEYELLLYESGETD